MEVQINQSFWQANFWGIVGSVTGVAGFIISWFALKYGTPQIEIDRMYLVIPDGAARDWKNKTLKNLKSNFLNYKLEIVVRNKRGGPGSIDKPNLVIGVPHKFMWLFNLERHIVIAPKTQHDESKKDTSYSGAGELWNIETVRHGRAFNLGGGEKVDEMLKYYIHKPKHIFDIVQNFDKLNYYAEYRDNNDKHHIKKITRTRNESDGYQS